MTAPLRIGIAGLGRLGWRHAQNLARRVNGALLAAACSPLEAERERARTGLGLPASAIYGDLDAMLDGAKLDAVVLVTPTAVHAQQTLAVLRRGLHVFVEKPLALNVADCEAVVRESTALAQQHPGQVALVGFVRRFDPSYATAMDTVRAGGIGMPFFVRSQTCDRLDPSGFFVQFAPSSGGIFLDCSVHDIDLARWFLSEGGTAPRATRVYATGVRAIHHDLAPIGDVDNGMALIEFEGGRRAALYASRTHAHGHETHTEVLGSAGQLLIGQGAARDRVVLSDAHGVRHQAVQDFFERFETAFERELQAFTDACRGLIAPPLSLSDALEATRIGVALRQSLETGAPVDL
ncbi:Gfo/Idh/MocA family oxidoreductase [Amphibiibacter pelophylacis]|uniref:Gfo/Idh/MocA family oxidoreductase n=1 Tax=Amphibiibacter pelophylacis TaxID=1799477 RepID=A0ACC6NY93_9BURK